jgi:GNAT superfamily N-acetyltransferase
MRADHTSARIEPWGDGDLPLLERLLGDPAMMAHLGGPESPERIANRQAEYRQPGSRQYRIVDPNTGAGAGWVGYWHREWRGSGVFEIGWSVAPEFQGRGLAGAAAALVIAIARAEREPAVHARLSIGRQRALERDLPAARLPAGRGRRLRVPARYHHALQRLAARPGRGLRGLISVPGTKLDSVHKSC